ncbi:hypothetical protein ACIBG7_05155 [Nonomuraea sp. NPDC050328]|uniref:hypothetical protein n=1 Tax=Nonomuraea sp. NPDC050328 TaxID=3364361 RepID=UPI003792A45A
MDNREDPERSWSSRRPWPGALAICVYALSVVLLAIVTENGAIGDPMYGYILSVGISFPLSIGGVLIGLLLEPLELGRHADNAIFVGPGIVQAVIFWWMLGCRRKLALTGILIFALVIGACGLAFLFDQWEYRRPWGVAFLALGVLQAALVMVGCLRPRSMP